MTAFQTTIRRFAQHFLVCTFTVFVTCGFTACSNSANCFDDSCDDVKNYLPLDDTEFPYVGIPRIVIETEDRQEIKDRETEVPAKLQVWGERAPESEIMEFTISGRGNSTWLKPKKPYTIKFEQKQNFMGMKEAKKWVLLANYFDRTLIRNAVAFEIAKKTRLDWVPSGKFAEVFLNGKFLGNYFVCEKVQINKNRLNISDDAYLLEFDKYYDEEFKFRSPVNDLPINIKSPSQPTEEQVSHIASYIDTIECILYGDCDTLSIEDYLDFPSFADYLIVNELAENCEPMHPKSVFMYKDHGPLKAGPVWDFDWGTFLAKNVKGWKITSGIWFAALMSNDVFKKTIQERWAQYKTDFEQIPFFIDSLVEYTKESNERNYAKWPISNKSSEFPDRDKPFDEAISMLRSTYISRISEMDTLINEL